MSYLIKGQKWIPASHISLTDSSANTMPLSGTKPHGQHIVSVWRVDGLHIKPFGGCLVTVYDDTSSK